MEPVRVLSPELVLVDWGPMTLTISAWRRGRPLPVAAAGAARRAVHCLAELADFQHLLRRPAERLPFDRQSRSGRPTTQRLPRVVGRAVEAALALGEGLSPLAAVAGAAADQALQAARELGADRVIVNNGGDIALFIPDRARVGLRPPAAEGAPPAGLVAALNVLPGDGVGGVASSGWQGRSFSPGVADLVTCWAADAASADAAATLVAGRTTVASPARITVPARRLDPASDLGDLEITRRVGRLNRAERLAALAGGMTASRGLRERGLLLGCLILVQGESAVLDPAGRLDWPGAADGSEEAALAR